MVDDRVVLRDRRRQITYDRDGVLEKWGVEPASIPDWLALVGDSSDGYPGAARLGREVGGGRPSRVRLDRRHPAEGERVAGPGPRPVRSASRRCSRSSATPPILYRTLARLRLDTPIPQRHAAELEWRGAPRATWEAFCDRLGPRPAALAAAPLARTRPASPPGRALRAPVASARSRAWNAGGAATSPDVRVGRAWSYQRGPVERGDRRARPAPRSSPAAAMSQAERPLSWTNASNRPLPT